MEGLHSSYDSANLGNETCGATQWPWGMDLLRVTFQFNVINTAVIQKEQAWNIEDDDTVQTLQCKLIWECGPGLAPTTCAHHGF